jgi:hypothetical protein
LRAFKLSNDKREKRKYREREKGKKEQKKRREGLNMNKFKHS